MPNKTHNSTSNSTMSINTTIEAAAQVLLNIFDPGKNLHHHYSPPQGVPLEASPESLPLKKNILHATSPSFFTLSAYL